jgi:predicted TIM-barrel enzyme
VDRIAKAALAEKPDTIILVHGGPVAMPEDADFILKSCGACHGFYGASSMERLPAETALTEQTRAFKRITGR